MNTYTFFALLICAIVAMVGAVANPTAPESAVDTAPAIPAEDVLVGAESRGYARGHDRGHNYGHDRGHYGHPSHHDHHDHHGR